MAVAKKKKAPKYGDLAAELDQILAGIEEGEIDIDDLSTKMERATELIQACREKLETTQISVQKVVSTLEAEAEEGEEWAEEEEEEDEEEAPF